MSSPVSKSSSSIPSSELSSYNSSMSHVKILQVRDIWACTDPRFTYYACAPYFQGCCDVNPGGGCNGGLSGGIPDCPFKNIGTAMITSSQKTTTGSSALSTTTSSTLTSSTTTLSSSTTSTSAELTSSTSSSSSTASTSTASTSPSISITSVSMTTMASTTSASTSSTSSSSPSNSATLDCIGTSFFNTECPDTQFMAHVREAIVIPIAVILVAIALVFWLVRSFKHRKRRNREEAVRVQAAESLELQGLSDDEEDYRPISQVNLISKQSASVGRSLLIGSDMVVEDDLYSYGRISDVGARPSLARENQVQLFPAEQDLAERPSLEVPSLQEQEPPVIAPYPSADAHPYPTQYGGVQEENVPQTQEGVLSAEIEQTIPLLSQGSTKSPYPRIVVHPNPVNYGGIDEENVLRSQNAMFARNEQAVPMISQRHPGYPRVGVHPSPIYYGGADEENVLRSQSPASVKTEQKIPLLSQEDSGAGSRNEEISQLQREPSAPAGSRDEQTPSLRHQQSSPFPLIDFSSNSSRDSSSSIEESTAAPTPAREEQATSETIKNEAVPSVVTPVNEERKSTSIKHNSVPSVVVKPPPAAGSASESRLGRFPWEEYQ